MGKKIAKKEVLAILAAFSFAFFLVVLVGTAAAQPRPVDQADGANVPTPPQISVANTLAKNESQPQVIPSGVAIGPTNAISKSVSVSSNTSVVDVKGTSAAPTVPAPTVIVGVPNAVGVVTLSGTREMGSEIWYSLDDGKTYKKLVNAMTTVTTHTSNGCGGTTTTQTTEASTSWSGDITLPVGSTSVLVQARKMLTVSGVPNTPVSSAPTSVGPITYRSPVPAPTVIVGVPNAVGVVTLSGTREMGSEIWYSLDDGKTYKKLVNAMTTVTTHTSNGCGGTTTTQTTEASTSWSGDITLPVGSTSILVQARKMLTVSGVPNTPVSSGPVIVRLM